MLEVVKQGLERILPKVLVAELIESYSELKNNFYLGHHRPNEVEGGRFVEAAFRILEYQTTNKFTPLGKQINTDKLIIALQNIPFGRQSESVRLHIPRTLRVIYDIRTKRDAVHLADGIDPNLQDSTFVVGACDWVMAEFVRLYHSVSPDEAQRIVEGIIEKKLPVVQDFNGFLKTLNPSWGPRERILATLYQRGRIGATVEELTLWLRPNQRPNIHRVLGQLEHDLDLIYQNDNKCFITNRGIKYVESSEILKPE